MVNDGQKIQTITNKQIRKKKEKKSVQNNWKKIIFYIIFQQYHK